MIFFDTSFVLYSGLLLIIALALILSSVLLIGLSKDLELNSAYECGFHPFEDTRTKFDVKFYLVSLLFIVFDLEVTFFFPLIFVNFDLVAFFYFFVFLFILTLGFAYEWYRGALEW